MYVQYTNPAGYPPLVHSSRILAQGGVQVLMLGTVVPGTDALRMATHPGITERRMGGSRPGWRQKLHYLRYLAWVVAWTVRWRPSWIYASDPLACPVALIAGGVTGARVVYHEHDSWTVSPAGVVARIVLAARRRLARRAAVCVLPNAERLDRFEAETRRTGTVLAWNCPTLDEVRPPREPWTGPELCVLYHGSIGPNLPLAVLEGMARLRPNVKLRVVGYETAGHRGYLDQLREAAHSFGLDGRLEVVGTVPRSQLLRWCESADVGLSLLPKFSAEPNERAMVGASNKPFDYLACGVVPLVPDLPAWRETYVDPGYALACDPGDPGSIAQALEWLAAHPDAMRAMGERGRQRVLLDWNYERQFAPVLDRIVGWSVR